MKQRIVSLYAGSLAEITDKMWLNYQDGERISSHAVTTDIRSDRDEYFQVVVVYEQDGGAE